ncbi:phosphate acyltransferase PlsX [uncultured Alistipes sp.]|uniref:phosphate acyltransferase PlsX n=1 Tax=uncultured Alistipes sp. TaxID=538949 RepID=UPI0026226275|nr:phosphate acyltransferase PlsX [uncultured Alistipes sp.]
MTRIGIDAMGGDYAPQAVVSGAILASRLVGPQSRIVLFGDKPRIEEILARENCPADTFDIVHTTEVIEMGDNPAQTFRQKPDSSIAVGFRYLTEGKIDGFASAGSTGAMMVGCMYTVKQIEGIIRPAISSVIPTIDGGEVMLLDVGLNVDCKPEVLYQYAVIGNLYAKGVLGKENPRVALLNIGEEKEKGNLQTKAAYELMDGSRDFNFVGNIEAKHLFSGKIADVVVCDGFAGNTIIKQVEGVYSMAMQQGLENTYFNLLNYETVGGTPVLGINAPVLIGHGCSSAEAIKNMVLQTERTIEARLDAKLRERFS